MIRNEVLDEQRTQDSQSGIQTRSGGLSGRTWVQLCGRWAQFRREWQYDWALEGDAAEVFPGKGKRTAEQRRIHELETENRRLRMEKEILKKATVNSIGRCNTKCLNPRFGGAWYGASWTTWHDSISKVGVMATLARR